MNWQPFMNKVYILAERALGTTEKQTIQRWFATILRACFFSAGKMVASSISLEIPIEGPPVSFPNNANKQQNMCFRKRLQSCVDTGEIYSLST